LWIFYGESLGGKRKNGEQQEAEETAHDNPPCTRMRVYVDEFAPVSWLCGLSVATLLRRPSHGVMPQWLNAGDAIRLQLRGSAGFAPASQKMREP
jgi:hypothetical protein